MNDYLVKALVVLKVSADNEADARSAVLDCDSDCALIDCCAVHQIDLYDGDDDGDDSN